MHYVNRKDVHHVNRSANPGYVNPKLDKYTTKELKDAVRRYSKAIKACEAEIRRRR